MAKGDAVGLYELRCMGQEFSQPSQRLWPCANRDLLHFCGATGVASLRVTVAVHWIPQGFFGGGVQPCALSQSRAEPTGQLAWCASVQVANCSRLIAGRAVAEMYMKFTAGDMRLVSPLNISR